MTYERLITRFDKPHTFFYLDPPYWGCESDYGKGLFKRKDFKNLSSILKEIKGRFILSKNDLKETRYTFYNLSGAQKKKKAKELLVMNY